MKLSILVPQKDQCGICTSAQLGNLSVSDLAEHVPAKNARQAHKAKDKES